MLILAAAHLLAARGELSVVGCTSRAMI